MLVQTPELCITAPVDHTTETKLLLLLLLLLAPEHLHQNSVTRTTRPSANEVSLYIRASNVIDYPH